MNPCKTTIHALFEEQVKETPDAIAVEFSSGRLSYNELNRRADALAEQLRRKGVMEETRVGLFIERSLNMIVGVLGILKSGGAYLPLDPHYPQERLAFIVRDAEIDVLVTQQSLVTELPEFEGELVCVDALRDFSTSEFPRSHCSSHNLAYVLYTSGSTGCPKGVLISHGAVVNFLGAMRQAPGLQADDVLLAITTLSFDIAGLELFLPLITGAKVVIAPRDVTLDGIRLAQLVADCGATVMQATPATWRMLIDSGWRGDRRLKILCGGEAFGSDLTERLLGRCGELWNLYGPTETTIYSTVERLFPGQPITIGRPIANTQVYIMDDSLRPVPVGVIGELFIGGDGVARGYWNRPELTGERFLPNPFDAKGSGRVYRTGDLARLQPDGKIEFLGRVDHQIKLRGFRIELGEIESVLGRQGGVTQAVVAACESTSGDKQLVAYIVPTVQQDGSVRGSRRLNPTIGGMDLGEMEAGSPVPSASSLRAALRLTLPEYMVPSAFVFLGALPLTPNGKVDRKALPKPSAVDDLERVDDAPRGETEEKLAGIIGALLKVPQFGRKDNFFDLGGHSILAATLFNEIERVFGRRLPLATLLRAATIEQLAEILGSDVKPSKKWRSLVPIQPRGTQRRFFCVHGAGGNVLLYRNLARHFGTDHPFYGLQSQGLDGQASLLTTVEEMAERYVGEIRELQREGPYCLGGYCLGGTIAYEIAQRLRRGGQEVALVALLDTYNFTEMEQPRPLAYVRQRAGFHLSNMLHLGFRHWPSYLSNKLRVAKDGEWESWLNVITGSSRTSGPGVRGSSLEGSVQKLNDQAGEAYRPTPYAGSVTVFKPKINYDFYPDAKMGWGSLVTGKLEIVELSVNPHAMLVEPYVRVLAERLKEAIGTQSVTQV